MSNCLRCGRDLKDPDALYGWRCAKKAGPVLSTPFDDIDHLADHFLNDLKNGNIAQWQGKKLNEQISPVPAEQILLPTLDVYKDIEKYDMEFVSNTPAGKSSSNSGLNVIKYQSVSPDGNTKYSAEVIMATKTVREWREYTDTHFEFDDVTSKALQYGGDSGAFDYLFDLFGKSQTSTALQFLFNVASPFLGKTSPKKQHILDQIEGRANDEEVTIVFEEYAWQQNTSSWAKLFNLDGKTLIHSKKHY